MLALIHMVAAAAIIGIGSRVPEESEPRPSRPVPQAAGFPLFEIGSDGRLGFREPPLLLNGLSEVRP